MKPIRGKDKTILRDFEAECRALIINTKSKLPPHNEKKRDEIKEKMLSNYGFFFETIFPHYCDDGNTKCAPFHIAAAEILSRMPMVLLFLIWFRGAAKSVHSNIGYPIWLMLRGEMKLMLLIGLTETKAIDLLFDTQLELQGNQILTYYFGDQYSYGNWEKGSFLTKSGAKFLAMGIDQDPSGARNGPYRVDYAVVDDCDNRIKARNKGWVKSCVERITRDLKAAGSKKTMRLVVANNYKVKHGLIAKLLEKTKKLSRTVISWVNIIDENGNPTWDRYSHSYIEDLREDEDPFDFESERMNNPIEEGVLFKEEWFLFGDIPILKDLDSIEVNMDLSYTDSGDCKSIAIMGRKNNKRYLIDLFCKQSSLSEAIGWLYEKYEEYGFKDLAKWNIRYEANATQKVFYGDYFWDAEDEFGYAINEKPDLRKKPNKGDRIEKSFDFYEKGNIIINKKIKETTHFTLLKSQYLGFGESGVKDDGPDAVEAALYYLNQGIRKTKNSAKSHKLFRRNKQRSRTYRS